MDILVKLSFHTQLTFDDCEIKEISGKEYRWVTKTDYELLSKTTVSTNIGTYYNKEINVEVNVTRVVSADLVRAVLSPGTAVFSSTKIHLDI